MSVAQNRFAENVSELKILTGLSEQFDKTVKICNFSDSALTRHLKANETAIKVRPQHLATQEQLNSEESALEKDPKFVETEQLLEAASVGAKIANSLHSRGATGKDQRNAPKLLTVHGQTLPATSFLNQGLNSLFQACSKISEINNKQELPNIDIAIKSGSVMASIANSLNNLK